MGSIHPLLLKLLTRRVEFVLIGGVAAILHGASTFTKDIDVCASFTNENLDRIVEALHDLDPRYRMTPQKLKMPSDASQLYGYKNLYLQTNLGEIDLLSEVDGVGPYSLVKDHAEMITLDDMQVPIMSIEDIIQSKGFLGRPKDRQVIAELRLVQEVKRVRPKSE